MSFKSGVAIAVVVLVVATSAARAGSIAIEESAIGAFALGAHGEGITTSELVTALLADVEHIVSPTALQDDRYSLAGTPSPGLASIDLPVASVGALDLFGDDARGLTGEPTFLDLREPGFVVDDGIGIGGWKGDRRGIVRAGDFSSSGRLAFSAPVVPLPPAILTGLAGLVGVILLRKRVKL
jgi:hypothetical protein